MTELLNVAKERYMLAQEDIKNVLRANHRVRTHLSFRALINMSLRYMQEQGGLASSQSSQNSSSLPHMHTNANEQAPKVFIVNNPPNANNNKSTFITNDDGISDDETGPAPVNATTKNKTDALNADGAIYRIVSREDLVAGYTGQTAIKTKKVLKSCAGGCLVIDEAYSLRGDEKDWFGIECINTLNLFMSQYPDEVIIIFLGYHDQTKQMLEANQGINRRIGWFFYISAYEPVDLVSIFLKQCEDCEWECNADEKEIVALFDRNKEYFRNQGGDTMRLLFQAKLVFAKQNWKEHSNQVKSASLESMSCEFPKTHPFSKSRFLHFR